MMILRSMESGDWRLLQWDGRPRPFLEVWHSALHHATTGAGFWIRYAILSRTAGRSRAEVWFVSTVPGAEDSNIAVAQAYPLDQYTGCADPFSIRIGPCSLDRGRMTGMLEVRDTPVTWDLVYNPVTDPLIHLPDFCYRTRFVATKTVSHHPFLLFGGKIQIGDRVFLFNGDPGEQGHLWGSRRPEEWIRFHCSAFCEEDGTPCPAYVSGIQVRPRLLRSLHLPAPGFGHLVWDADHIPLRVLTRWEDRWGGGWRWIGRLTEEEVRVDLRHEWADVVTAVFESPSGPAQYCHHTDRASCTVHFQAPRRPPRIFRAENRAHLEIGSLRLPRPAGRVVSIQSE